MQAAQRADALGAGPQRQVIGVAEDDARAQRARDRADDSALTLACVPTGMNTGVSIGPCAVCSTPARAVPSRATTSNAPRGALTRPASR